MKIIDDVHGMDLFQDEEGHFAVAFEGTSGGNTLTFAHLQGTVFDPRENTDVELNARQVHQVELWFEEYEA